MLKTSQRFHGVAKRKKNLVERRIPTFNAHNHWVEYVNAYWTYSDSDFELQRIAAYKHWVEDGHTFCQSTYENDIPHLLNHPPHKAGQPGQPKTQPKPPLPQSPPHLYALEVDDLLDFTEADILAAWNLRTQTCGSLEAAAELYALYRVLDGTDEVYAGFIAYLEHPDVVAIFISSEVSSEILTTDGLTLRDIRDLSLTEMTLAWANRPDSFASLEAAAETLANLRAVNSQSFGAPNYRLLLAHDLIKELEDSLPLEKANAPAPSPLVELQVLSTDHREMRIQTSVVRHGQGNFRVALFKRYNAKCVITGCTIDTLLEAAHIIPYRGDHSHDVLNGLLLRVDIHRLFDAHLISINPQTLTVELASALNDDAYKNLHGKRLFVFSPKPRTLYLDAHHRKFIALSTN